LLDVADVRGFSGHADGPKRGTALGAGSLAAITTVTTEVSPTDLKWSISDLLSESAPGEGELLGVRETASSLVISPKSIRETVVKWAEKEVFPLDEKKV
jgi:hypothetical protein